MSSKAPTIGLVGLGCPKALVDSERIVTSLRSAPQALTRTAPWRLYQRRMTTTLAPAK